MVCIGFRSLARYLNGSGNLVSRVVNEVRIGKTVKAQKVGTWV